MSTAQAKRGTKRTCVACGERFYDLARDPIVCPACGNVHGPEAFVRHRPLAEVVAAPVAAAAAKPEAEDDDLDLDEVGLDDDDTLIDDGDDLDDDDDGIEDVVIDVDGDDEDS
ncbi:MAG: FYDLN acid domain-containing protein [Alphaproteobacteria bacterium]|nr:FYDLN acid domain-containing protein [Alphaproteobacteria bacterium]